MAESPTQGRPNLDWRLLELILVAIGAVPGALIRWQAAGVYFGDGDNVVVNVAGAFILGLLVGRGVDARWQLLVGTGFCGALTTFSAWMVDCVVLMAAGQWLQAAGLLGITLGLGLGFGALGVLLGRLLRRPRPSQSP